MAKPTRLFRRFARVTVNTIQIANGSLDVAFKVKKTLVGGKPNDAEIRVWNLSPTNRKALESLGQVPVHLEAGYEDGYSTLFLGNLRRAYTVRDGVDLITVIGSGDGEKAIQTSRVSVTIQKGTPSKDALRKIAKALGVGDGNLAKAETVIRAQLGNVWAEGTILTGSASREMTNVCRSLGLEWSIQNEALQIIPLGQALEGEAFLLSEDTGLIGNPSVDTKGVLKARMLIAPDLFPGRKIVLQAELLQGQFRAETCTYSGDTGGGDWYCDIEAKRY